MAPPKDSAAQASFNDLPVEMIREILLRLNDYRDLVSSAQASPVMQLMIDNQHIWKKLCKYHFTEQQLRFALENRSNYQLVSSIKQRTNDIQGVKYARTSSADGQGSYRNAVDFTTTKSKKKDGSSKPTRPSNNRQRRNLAKQTDGDDGQQQSSSYVTRTIRIFDRECSSSATSSPMRRKSEIANLRKFGQEVNGQPSDGQRRQSCSSGGPSTTNQGRPPSSHKQASATNNSRSPSSSSTSSSSPSSFSSQEIDWERVFHQLRK